MFALPTDNPVLASVRWRTQLGFWLSLLSLAAFVASIYLIGFAPRHELADFFSYGGSLGILDTPLQLLLILLLIVWLVALLCAVGLAWSVIGNGLSGRVPGVVALRVLNGVSILLTHIQLACVVAIIVLNRDNYLFERFRVDYIVDLIVGRGIMR